MDQKRYLRRVRMNQFEKVCRRWKEVSVIFLASNIQPRISDKVSSDKPVQFSTKRQRSKTIPASIRLSLIFNPYRFYGAVAFLYRSGTLSFHDYA